MLYILKWISMVHDIHTNLKSDTWSSRWGQKPFVQSIICVHCHVYTGFEIKRLASNLAESLRLAMPLSPESLIKSEFPVLNDTEFISTQNHSSFFPTLIILLLWQNSSTGSILPHSSLGSGLIWLDIDNQQTNKFIEAAKRFPA